MDKFSYINIREYLIPVSYTHLDVYKRQTLICLVIVFLAVCGWIKGGINLFYVLTGTALVILYKTGWIQKCRNIEKKLVEETDNPFQMIL